MAQEERADAVRAALVRAVDGLLLALVSDRAGDASRHFDCTDRAQGWCADGTVKLMAHRRDQPLSSSMVGSGTVIAAKVEEVVDRVVDGQEALNMAG